jgi:hypothetical protein
MQYICFYASGAEPLKTAESNNYENMVCESPF